MTTAIHETRDDYPLEIHGLMVTKHFKDNFSPCTQHNNQSEHCI